MVHVAFRKVTMQEVKDSCLDAAQSAAGPDGFEPAEMRMLSDAAYQGIADLFNLVEDGAPWPATLNKARAAFLEKNPEHRGDPTSLRVLLMLPAIYRRWAAIRLITLRPWIEQWADDAILRVLHPWELKMRGCRCCSLLKN